MVNTKKLKKLSKKFGERIINTGKRVAPVIKKQAQLIRDQQLRDEAIERARARRARKRTRKKVSKRIKKGDSLGIFEPLDF